MSDNDDKTSTIVILVFVLLALIAILFYLYRRLNRDTNDQYSIQQFFSKEGGFCDRVSNGITVVVDCLLTLFQNDQQENVRHVEEGNNNVDGDDHVEDVAEELDGGENKKEEQKEQHEEDSSDDYSSIDLKEKLRQNITEDGKKKEEECKIEVSGTMETGSKERDENNEERVGLLVDIKTLSGSAIWSEEKMQESDVTAL